MTGVYCITNIVNNKKYIGQAVNIEARWKTHIKKLNNNTHINSHLQSSWNKYRKENFIFSVLEVCDEKDLTEKENFWIIKHNTLDKNYGFNKREAGSKGKLSEETKQKIGRANKKNPPTKECLEKSAVLRRGKHLSDETKEKISKSNMGKMIPDDVKKKISTSHIGLKHSLESIELMHKIKAGENHPRFGKKKENSTSLFFGVSYKKTRKKWIAQLSINKKNNFIGYFLDELDAAKAYDMFVLKTGLTNPLNFPELKERYYDKY